jgi:S-adenosylmethionine decarboxylase
MLRSALGQEWVVEAHGCDPTALADLATLQQLFARMVDELSLHEVTDPIWHQFPRPSGITGLSLLAESHLTVHTFPEHGTLCLNLFCCTPRPEWDYATGLRDLFGADHVDIRVLDRRYTPSLVP